MSSPKLQVEVGVGADRESSNITKSEVLEERQDQDDQDDTVSPVLQGVSIKRAAQGGKLPSLVLKSDKLTLARLERGCKKLSKRLKIVGESMTRRDETSSHMDKLNEDLRAAVASPRMPDVEKVRFITNNYDSSLLDLNQRDTSGMSLTTVSTILPCSPYHERCEILDLLLTNGAEKDTNNYMNESLLILACKTGQFCKAVKLLNHNAPLNSVSVEDETALTCAIRQCKPILVRRLLREGADFGHRVRSGKTPLDVAAQLQLPACIHLLQDFRDKSELAFERARQILWEHKDLFELHDGYALTGLHVTPIVGPGHFRLNFDGKHVTSDEHPVVFMGVGAYQHVSLNNSTELVVECRMHGRCPITSVVINGLAVDFAAAPDPWTQYLPWMFELDPYMDGTKPQTLKSGAVTATVRNHVDFHWTDSTEKQGLLFVKVLTGKNL